MCTYPHASRLIVADSHDQHTDIFTALQSSMMSQHLRKGGEKGRSTITQKHPDDVRATRIPRLP